MASESTRPTLAIVSTDIRRDLVAPMRCFERLHIVHYYRYAPYGDLAPEDMDGSLLRYTSPRDLFWQLERARPDIVQGVEPFSFRLLPYQAAISLYTRLRGVPLFAGAHIGRPLHIKYGRLPALLLRVLAQSCLRSTRLFFYLNEGARRNLLWLGVPEAKLVRHMYGTWGIDPDEFTPLRDGREPKWQQEPVLLFVGRIHAEKGIFDLLEAYGQIRCLAPAVHLAVIGDGPQRGQVERLVHEKGWHDYVHLLGTVKNRDLPPYFRAATLFVSPAVATRRWEEYVGMTNLQAMACGLPVISTRSGAIPEYVPETAGVLVPEHDPEALAAAVLCLLPDEARRREMGQAGRSHAARHYDARKNVQLAERIILERCLPTWEPGHAGEGQTS